MMENMRMLTWHLYMEWAGIEKIMAFNVTFKLGIKFNLKPRELMFED